MRSRVILRTKAEESSPRRRTLTRGKKKKILRFARDDKLALGMTEHFAAAPGVADEADMKAKISGTSAFQKKRRAAGRKSGSPKENTARKRAQDPGAFFRYSSSVHPAEVMAAAFSFPTYR